MVLLAQQPGTVQSRAALSGQLQTAVEKVHNI